MHSRTDHVLYEGLRLWGGAACTIRRGEVIWDGTTVTGRPGSERFVPRVPDNNEEVTNDIHRA